MLHILKAKQTKKKFTNELTKSKVKTEKKLVTHIQALP